eukprot:COSAG04_NODE_1381_length_6993_cov_41.974471_5_plen_103_part_00
MLKFFLAGLRFYSGCCCCVPTFYSGWCCCELLWCRNTDIDALAALYVRDCTVGIEGTEIKAGIIKCAHQVSKVPLFFTLFTSSFHSFPLSFDNFPLDFPLDV